jgi:DNA-binding NtrC family response regulator
VQVDPAARPKSNSRRPRRGTALDILVVDDDTDIRQYLSDLLRQAGHRVSLAADGAQAGAQVSAHVFDLVLSDVRLPRGDGRALLRRVRHESPSTDVILITAFGEVSDAVAALKDGAHDYLTKPVRSEELLVRIERIAAERDVRRELQEARDELSRTQAEMDDPIIGRSPSIERLLERVGTIAASEAPVLIHGESGSGKELVARTLHRRSARQAGPFVAVNCAAFPESLLEAELFGHERGAFTGAVRRRDGRFKAADGGTLLLDEIAEIPLPAQAKLLRVLQEGSVEPLGTNESVSVDVRVISATHRDLKERIAQGLFREDLYYRLNVLDLTIPPLRERRADLPLLVEHFLRRATPAGKEASKISPRAWAALYEHAYPGNVRELAHAIQHAVVLARGGEIDMQHLPRDISGVVPAREQRAGELQPLSLALREFEKIYLGRALVAAGGKKTAAARLLGISRKTLWEKLRAHGLSGGDLE